MRKFLILVLPLLFCLSPSFTAAAEIERIALHQREAVQVEHQRRGGNARTQAQVQGWIVRVPQLFIYLSDYSAAFHMDGIRSGFERQLNWVIDRSRTERSMIRLDRLLERLTTEDGEEFSLESLPRADVYILLYRRAECETCDELDDMLSAWLDTKPGLKAVRLDIAMDRIL